MAEPLHVGNCDVVDAARLANACSAVAVAIAAARYIERDGPAAAVGTDRGTAVEQAVDEKLEIADMLGTAVADAVDGDSAKELAKDNGSAPADGYMEARNRPFGMT